MAAIALYRAADDGIVTDSASFAANIDVARAYLDNPGFGGRSLWSADVEIDTDTLLDLYDDETPEATLADLLGHDYGAIGADELVPRVAEQLAALGYEWVRVRDSYPQDAETYIWVGGEEPELDECE